MANPEKYDPSSDLEKQKQIIEKKFILRRWQENPELIVQYLNVRNKYWKEMQYQRYDSQYEKTAVLKFYENSKKEKKILDSLVGLGDLAPYRAVQIGAKIFESISNSLEAIANGELESRRQFGKEIMSDPYQFKSLERMLDMRQTWNVAIAEGYVNSKITDQKEAFKNILVSDSNYFYGAEGIGIPDNIEDTIRGLSVYDQVLYANDFIEFKKAKTGTANDPQQLKKIEKELKDISKNYSDLEGKLTDFIKEELKKEEEEQDQYKEQAKIADYKGYAQLLGYIVGIENPKLGNAITQGTSSIIDAFTSFKNVKMDGAALAVGSAASLASGIGSVLTVISILQGLNGSGEDQTMKALMEGLKQINENINQLREEIKESFKRTFEMIGYVIEQAENNAENTRQMIKETNDLIREFTKRELESDFQEKNNDIYSSYEEFSTFADQEKVYQILNSLYIKGIFDASIEKYSRYNESVKSLYEYLDFSPQFKNDGFRWSPLENRPVLLQQLIDIILKIDAKKEFKKKNNSLIKEAFQFYSDNPPKKENLLADFLPPFQPMELDWDIINKYYKVKTNLNDPTRLEFSLKYDAEIIFVSPKLRKLFETFSIKKLQEFLSDFTVNSAIDFQGSNPVSINLLNPILCSSTTKYFTNVYSHSFLHGKLPFNENYLIEDKASLDEKLLQLYNANVWFSTCAELCANEDVLRIMLEQYMQSVDILHHALFQSLNFQNDLIKNENEKISLFNEFNSKSFIENGINIYSCYLPDTTHFNDGYNSYRNQFKSTIEKFSNVYSQINKGDFQLKITDATLNGRVNVDRNIENRIQANENYVNTLIELNFDVLDKFGIPKFLKIKISDKREAVLSPADIEISANPQFGGSWRLAKIRYLGYIGSGCDVLSINSPFWEGGSLYFTYEHRKQIKLSKGLFQEDLQKRVLEAIGGKNIIETFLGTETHNVSSTIGGISVGYSWTEADDLQLSLTFPQISLDYSSLNLTYIDSLIQNAKECWINLSTALLCYCNKFGDFRNYEILLTEKPKLFESVVTKDNELFVNITGKELEKLYLLNFLNQDANVEDKKIRAFGIKINNRISERDFNENVEPDSPDLINNSIHFLEFNNDNNEADSKFKLDNSLINNIFTILKNVTDQPLVMPSITHNTDEAIEYCHRIINTMSLLNIDAYET
jgi:hypothetical protein